jgi:hypothetical protein
MSKAQQGKKCKHWKGIKYKMSHYYFELSMDDEQDLTEVGLEALGLTFVKSNDVITKEDLL